MSFLPSDYKVPSGSGQFMKLQDGENRFRILTNAVIGWEGWKDGKPFRRKGAECTIKEEEVDYDAKYDKPKINHFWAFAVWNVNEKKVQILQITQTSIMKDIKNYYMIDDFGDPKGYDLVVARTKENNKTVYRTAAMPPKPAPVVALEAMEKSKIDLEKLFEGSYPMEPDHDEEEEDEVPLI